MVKLYILLRPLGTNVLSKCFKYFFHLRRLNGLVLSKIITETSLKNQHGFCHKNVRNVLACLTLRIIMTRWLVSRLVC